MNVVGEFQNIVNEYILFHFFVDGNECDWWVSKWK